MSFSAALKSSTALITFSRDSTSRTYGRCARVMCVSTYVSASIPSDCTISACVSAYWYAPESNVRTCVPYADGFIATMYAYIVIEFRTMWNGSGPLSLSLALLSYFFLEVLLLLLLSYLLLFFRTTPMP